MNTIEPFEKEWTKLYRRNARQCARTRLRLLDLGYTEDQIQKALKCHMDRYEMDWFILRVEYGLED